MKKFVWKNRVAIGFAWCPTYARWLIGACAYSKKPWGGEIGIVANGWEIILLHIAPGRAGGGTAVEFSLFGVRVGVRIGGGA